MLVTKALSGDEADLKVTIRKGEFNLAKDILEKGGFEFEKSIESHYLEKGEHYLEIKALLQSDEIKSIEKGKLTDHQFFNINWIIRNMIPEVEPTMRMLPQDSGKSLIALPGKYSEHSGKPSYFSLHYDDFFRQLWRNMNLWDLEYNHMPRELIIGKGYGGYLRCNYQVIGQLLFISEPQFVARAYLEKFGTIVQDSKGESIEYTYSPHYPQEVVEQLLTPIPLDMNEEDLHTRFVITMALKVEAAIQKRKAELFNQRYPKGQGLNHEVQSASVDFDI